MNRGITQRHGGGRLLRRSRVSRRSCTRATDSLRPNSLQYSAFEVLACSGGSQAKFLAELFQTFLINVGKGQPWLESWITKHPVFEVFLVPTARKPQLETNLLDILLVQVAVK